MNDYLIRLLSDDKQIRAFAVSSTNLVEHTRKIYNYSPIATACLGRLMSAALMMGQMLKSNEDKLTIQILCDGPLKHVIVTSSLKGTVRGFASNPNVILPPNKEGHLNVGGAISNGTLTVIRDMGLKEPYVSSIDIQTGEIASDLTYYYALSEQIPTSIGLGVLFNHDNYVSNAGGFIIQLLPFAKKEVVDILERNINSFSSVTDVLRSGKTIEEMMQILFKDIGFEITGKIPVSFECNCSYSRGKEVLATLKKEDLDEMIKEGKDIEVNCDFCNKHYKYSIDDLKEIRSHIK